LPLKIEVKKGYQLKDCGTFFLTGNNIVNNGYRRLVLGYTFGTLQMKS